ncbi:urease accessory protein UreD [Embleya scabrispora]|uniref:urease accessory protein UreD n=1 Tax=Embleya scabrispora TaxID=159449 RepID=UPI00131A228D|nr:urease accessory protein UreD [Embleya scabrispora]MYS84319.1 urease accessory protein UreD [Streptomyces sp. SID5474]
MKATAVIRAEVRHGRTVLAELRGQVPLLPREVSVSGDTAEVVFVGGAAGPIGGDDLALRVEVGAGARLRVRTAAAAVILLGDGTPARQRVDLVIGAGGLLEWLPEPVVVAARATFHTRMRAEPAPDAHLFAQETLVLGRAGEPSGDVLSRWDVLVGGRPVLRQQSAYGPAAHPGWRGPAGTAGGTVVASRLTLPAPPDRLPSAPGRAVCDLAGGGRLVTVTARDVMTARRALEAAPIPADQVSRATSSEPAVPINSTPPLPAGAAVR